MPTLPALRTPPKTNAFRKGDVLVLFGELFARGYANGLVEEAERQGMTIVRATVGRREKDGVLRALTEEEAALVPKPFINVPLEAGFDMEPDSKGRTPIDFLKETKLTNWSETILDETALEESRQKAVARFRANTTEFMRQLKTHIPKGANVVFAHLMAGGVPRIKIVMPLINRIVKGTGDRYLPSKELWDSSIGQFCDKNFHEVTAETYRHLVELSAPIREQVEKDGGQVSYLAYGYHGTEILTDGQYNWKTYTPYVQGWAKMHLENLSEGFHGQGLKSCVYNCPEILTNSSSIFQGVEVSLYSLLQALQKEAPNSAITKRTVDACTQMMKDGEAGMKAIAPILEDYWAIPEIQSHCVFESWPQHTSQKQLETMLNTSEALYELHKDSKQLITAVLSEVVFEACGRLMLNDAAKPATPVSWIGHDVIAKLAASPT